MKKYKKYVIRSLISFFKSKQTNKQIKKVRGCGGDKSNTFLTSKADLFFQKTREAPAS